jgi:hypothetical protein
MKTTITIAFLVAAAFVPMAKAQDRAAPLAQPVAGAAPQPVPSQALTSVQIEAIANAEVLPQGTSRQLSQELDRIAELYRLGRHDEATSRWIRVVQPHAGNGKDRGKEWVEIESWSNYVLNRAFIQPDAALRARAAEVRSTGMRHETAELQAALQKRQKTYTTLSNVMKKLHDTAKGAIRNVK